MNNNLYDNIFSYQIVNLLKKNKFININFIVAALVVEFC